MLNDSMSKCSVSAQSDWVMGIVLVVNLSHLCAKNAIAIRVSDANVVSRVLHHALTRTKNQLKQIVFRISYLEFYTRDNQMNETHQAIYLSVKDSRRKCDILMVFVGDVPRIICSVIFFFFLVSCQFASSRVSGFEAQWERKCEQPKNNRHYSILSSDYQPAKSKE